MASRQIVYSTSRVPNLDGRTFQNPRHFNGVIEGATKVYIDGDWPVVSAAYEAAGVPVAPLSDMRGAAKAKQPSGAPQTGAEPNP